MKGKLFINNRITSTGKKSALNLDNCTEILSKKKIEELISNVGGSSGADLIVKVNSTKEILATGETQTILIKGINLNEINSIVLEDANVIDVNTDLLIIDDNNAELTVTMNSTEGEKNITINSILTTSWIKSLDNSGYTLLGSDANYPFVVGTDIGIGNSFPIQVIDTIDTLPSQTNLGIKVGQGSTTHYKHNVVLNAETIANKNEILDIVMSVDDIGYATDYIYMALIDNSKSLSISKYGLDSTIMRLRVLKGHTQMSDRAFKITRRDNSGNILNATVINDTFPMPAANEPNRIFIKVSMSITGVKWFQLKDIDDDLGIELGNYQFSDDIDWGALNKNFAPMFANFYVGRSDIIIYKIRKRTI